jgi:hypothetical protein
MKGNDSKEKVVASISRYMGIANLGIIAVNPTAEEIQKLLVLEELPKEPVYKDIKTKDRNDNEQLSNKVRLLLRGTNPILQETPDGKTAFVNEVVTATFDIFVSDREVVASTGAPRTLNALGVDTWQTVEKIEANEKMAWFSKHKPLYAAREGELELLKVFREFLNIGTRDECKFEDFKKIANGDVSELRRYITKWPQNAATFLLGVKESEDGEKEYQTVYGKCFSRPSVKNNTEKFIKALNEEYGDFKAIYPSDLKLKVYTKKLEIPDDNPATTATTSGNGWV